MDCDQGRNGAAHYASRLYGLGGEKQKVDEYPVELYREFLHHVKEKYRGQYWNALPKDVARHSRRHIEPQYHPGA